MQMKLVLGKPFMVVGHDPVPFHLGDDGSGSHGYGEGISFNDGALGDERDLGEMERVQKKAVRGRLEGCEGPSTGEARGFQDIQRINFLFGGRSDRPSPGSFGDEMVEGISLGLGKEF